MLVKMFQNLSYEDRLSETEESCFNFTRKRINVSVRARGCEVLVEQQVSTTAVARNSALGPRGNEGDGPV